MNQLTRDEVRQKLRVMLYQEQKPVSRIAKDCGMDAKTVQLASNGEMTNRTLLRFSRWFSQIEKGIINPSIRENYTVVAQGSTKDITISNLGKLYQEQRNNNPRKHGIARAKLEQMTQDELSLLYYQTENKMKYGLLKKYKELIDRYHMWLYDKWDYWQWKEKVEVTLQDTGRSGTFQPR